MKVFPNIIRASIAISFLVTAIQPVLSDSPEYEKALAHGLKQLKSKDYQGATASFTSVLRDYPTVYEAYLDRAQSRLGLKDYEGALSDYDQAIKINPNVVEAYVKRGDLKQILGNQQASIDDYTLALSLSPKDLSAIQRLARSVKLSGDYAKAAELYSTAMKLEPTSIAAREEHAECKLKSSDYEAAAEDYNYLLKKFKQQLFGLHYNLGMVLALKGEKQAALDNFNQVIEYCSKSLGHSHDKAADYILRGLAYAQKGENDKAISDLEKGVALLPDDGDARYKLGHARLEGSDAAGAIKDLNEALKLDSTLTSALFDRGAALLSEGEFKSAKADLDAAVSAERNASGFLNRSMARLGLGDTSGALVDAIEAKKLDPKGFEARQEKISDSISKAGGQANNDLTIAQYLEQLAILDLAEDKPDSAETLVKRAMAIQTEKLSESDQRRAISLMLLGSVNLEKRSLLRAEALFRSALTRLRNYPDAAKYAVLNLEECAKILLRSGNEEQAGSILADTRLERSATGLREQVLTGDLSRQADHALDVYRQKKQNEQRKTVAEASSPAKSEPLPQSTEATSTKRSVESQIRDKWAVIIGISNFKDASINLHYAANDAQDFYNFLVKEKNFAPDHVQLLTDSIATRANILSVLGNKWLPRVAEPNDLVVIYFSTHGSPSSLDVGGVNYLVAHDTDVNDLYATGIAMQDLARIIKARVHSDRVMLVLDACHSGGAAPSSKGLSRAGNIDVEQIMQGTGQLVISSSEPDQVSWESKRYNGSVFTKHLIEGLRSDGELTKLGNAFSHLQVEVQREVLRDRGILQTPVMKSQWEGKDLILGAPPAAPSRGLTEIVLPDLPKAASHSGFKSGLHPTNNKGSSSSSKTVK